MTKIAVILTQGFADWEYALIAGTGGPFYGLDVQFFTPETGEVLSQGGLNALVQQSLDDIPAWKPEVIVAVGGGIWEASDAPDISELLRSHHAGGGTVAGICGGTLALARAGLLNETPHTSNAPDFLKDNAEEYSGADFYHPTPSAVTSNRIISAPGTAPVSFTAAVFASAEVAYASVEQFRIMLAAEHTPITAP